MHAWLIHPVVQTAIAGLVAAAALDAVEFRKWQLWRDAEYDWSVAIDRWVLGLVTGLVSGWVLNALVR